MNRDFIKEIIYIFLCLGLFSGIFFCSSLRAAEVNTSVVITVCGNNIIEGNETCDDGNVIPEDGCSSICRLETAPSEERSGGTRIIPYEEAIYYTRVILEGWAYPDALVNVIKDGYFLASIRADSQARFKVEINDITPGNYTFGLWAEDKNKVRSINFTISFYVAPATTTMVNGILLPPTNILAKNLFLSGETLEVFGQAIPNGTIRIFIYPDDPSKEIIKLITSADINGDWNYFFDTKDLKKGSYRIKTKSESPQGLMSIFSNELSFEIKSGSLLPEPIPPVPGFCSGADFNQDGKVNLIDFSIMLYWWEGDNDCIDLNNTGKIDLTDFSILLYWWTG